MENQLFVYPTDNTVQVEGLRHGVDGRGPSSPSDFRDFTKGPIQCFCKESISFQSLLSCAEVTPNISCKFWSMLSYAAIKKLIRLS